MSRNSEKHASMLHRYYAAKSDKPINQQRRPHLASLVTDLIEAERWRNSVIRDISKNVSLIQDSSQSESVIRDLNDKINKLLREKIHWEKQIKLLGGKDYTTETNNNKSNNNNNNKRSFDRLTDADGLYAISRNGYYYFGAAKQLNTVKELFNQSTATGNKSTRTGSQQQSDQQQLSLAQQFNKRSRSELLSGITIDYYGYRELNDSRLLEAEQKIHPNNNNQNSATNSSSNSSNQQSQSQSQLPSQSASLLPIYSLPTPESIQKQLLAAKKAELLKRYGGLNSNSNTAAASTTTTKV